MFPIVVALALAESNPEAAPDAKPDAAADPDSDAKNGAAPPVKRTGNAPFVNYNRKDGQSFPIQFL